MEAFRIPPGKKRNYCTVLSTHKDLPAAASLIARKVSPRFCRALSLKISTCGCEALGLLTIKRNQAFTHHKFSSSLYQPMGHARQVNSPINDNNALASFSPCVTHTPLSLQRHNQQRL